MERAITHRQGLGTSAKVLQVRRLLSCRIIIDGATIIVVRRGSKVLRWNGQERRVNAGDMVAVATGQTFDVLNVPCDSSGLYEARWLNFSADWLAGQQQSRLPVSSRPRDVLRLPAVEQGVLDAFDRACDALHPSRSVPEQVASIRLLEVLMWLDHHGCALAPPVVDQISMRIRQLVNSNLASDWTSTEIARHLCMSEATLRRRLASEDASFQNILIDTRMSHALTLLQVTDKSITAIASDVGYSSASRFTARFRERFGYLPSDIRSSAFDGSACKPDQKSAFASVMGPLTATERMPRLGNGDLPVYALNGPD